jgi:MFS family permease
MQGPLVRDARFAPMFWTQALGAFNDNLFKNALVIGITYGGVEVFGIEPSKIAAPASALFMLPFFLFSATAGQLADKLEKSQLIRATKLMEIAIMAVAGVGFLLAQYELLLVLLFLMGTQSALFGPVKYGILPQLVDEDDLVSGNALVELATYLAILTGTIAGGVIVGATIGGVAGSTWLGVALLAVALLGWWQSRQIPEAPAENPTLEVQWDPIRPTIEILGVTRANRPIWLAALGISWFWGLGTMLLAVFPSYTLDVLGADEHIATLFLAAFSIGIGAGSMLCERLSKHRLELGVVPIGSFFMSVFLVDLWLLDIPWEPNPEALLTLGDFLATGTGLHIVADLVGFAMAGGLYIVPRCTPTCSSARRAASAAGSSPA